MTRDDWRSKKSVCVRVCVTELTVSMCINQKANTVY